MNLYLLSPQTVTKSMQFNLSMGAGDILVIISNKISVQGSTIKFAQCGGVTFYTTTQPTLGTSGISPYMKYLEEFIEYNKCTVPDDFMIFVSSAADATQDVIQLFNKSYFRFFILENAHPNLVSLFNDKNYPFATVLEY